MNKPSFKPRWMWLTVIPLILLSPILFFQNCSDVSFSKAEQASVATAIPSITNASIKLNNGAAFTNDINVRVSLSADNADQVLLSNSATCDDATDKWIPYVQSTFWELSGTNKLVYAYAKFKNKEGAVSACLSADITHDSLPPTVKLNGPANPYYKEERVPFQTEAKDNLSSDLKLFCKLNNGAYAPCNVNFEAVVQEGVHKQMVYAEDMAGNQSVPAEVNWTRDITAPVVKFNSTPAAVSTNAIATFTYEATDARSGVAKYLCAFDNMTATDCGSATTVTKALADGNRKLTLVAEDRAGNQAMIAYNWTIATTPSDAFNILGISSPMNEDMTIDQYLAKVLVPRVNWERSNGAVNYIVSILSAAGAELCRSPLPVPTKNVAVEYYDFGAANCTLVDGQSYKAKVVAYNNVGLTREALLFDFKVDASGPVITISKITVDDKNKKAVAEFTIKDAVFDAEVATVQCYRTFNAANEVSDCKNNALAAAPNNYSKEYANLNLGDHEFYVTASDPLGNMTVSLKEKFVLKQLVCDPFSLANEELCETGLRGRLVYQNKLANEAGWNKVDEYLTKGFDTNVDLRLSQVFVPTRVFSAGFQIGPNMFVQKRAEHGSEKLVEWFAFEVTGFLKLGPGETAGDYELAILSDDGAILEYKASAAGAYQKLIDNDGFTSTRMSCATSTLALDANSRIPIRLKYFQGPQTEIAVNFIYRKKVANAAADSLCGVADGQFYGLIANQNQLATTHAELCANYPNSKYAALCARGWKPLASANFINTPK